MKSIMQENKKICYICSKIGMGREQRGLEEHHIYGGHGRREISERYGMKVYLCPGHHQFGPDAVHKLPNEGWDLMLKQIGQERFEQVYPNLDFIKTFGKSYL